MEEIALQIYLTKKKKKLSKLEEEIMFLETITVPILVRRYYEGITLISNDYTLATQFKIEHRSELKDSFSNYDGGVYTQRHEFYPQFYFNVKRNDKDFRVYVEHEGFNKDKNIVLRSYDVTKGSGDYSNENRNSENYINRTKVISFFENKGVKNELLNKLEKKIEKNLAWMIL